MPSRSLFIAAPFGDYVLVPAFGGDSLRGEPVSPESAARAFERWRDGMSAAALRAFVLDQFGADFRSLDESGYRARLAEILAQLQRGDLRMLRLRRPVAGAPFPKPKEVEVEVEVEEGEPVDDLEVEPPVTPVRPLLRVRVIGMHFDTNKSFLLDTAMRGIRKVVEVYRNEPNGKLLIVGHTDTTGDEAYNLDLSVERAEAMKAYLKDDVPAWEAWFGEGKPSQKRWGSREIDAMISTLPCGPTVGDFQQWSNDTRGTELAVDGIAGPKTRKALIEAYMAIDGTTLPSAIDAEIHGCGEFFPRDDTGDGVEDPDNRRVEMFCFHRAITPPVPGKKATKGEPEYAEWQKQVTREIDVEAGIEEPGIILSPPVWLSEREFEQVEVHLVHRGAAAGERDITIFAGDDIFITRTDSNGTAAVRVTKDLDRLRVRFTPPGATMAVERELLFELPQADSDDGLVQRLLNLGYPAETDRIHAVLRFQLDFGLEPTGEADVATRQKVASVYERGAG
jgi:outer membrane protein OmpA-like peptidoglycan-associated protein